MNRVAFAVWVLVCLSFANAALAKDWREPRNRRGFEMWAGVGVNACVPDGDADCDNIDPSVAGTLSIGGRFIPYVGVFLDISGGLLDPGLEDSDSADVTMSTLTIMPVVRGYIPLPLVDIYFGFGAGYSSLTVSAESDGESGSVKLSSFLQPKLQTGVAFNVASNFAVGVNLDLIIHGDEDWEMCVEEDGDKACQDIDDAGDFAELFQGTAYVRMNF